MENKQFKKRIIQITYDVSDQNTMVLAFDEIEADFFAGFFRNFDVNFVDRRRIRTIYSELCLREQMNVTNRMNEERRTREKQNWLLTTK